MKTKGAYVDGFVLAVPKKNVAAYKKMAREGAKMWKKYGALDYKECMIDDAKPAYVTLTFGKMLKAKPSETIWFSYIVYKSKAHRDAVNKKVMAGMDEHMEKHKDFQMPFEMNRMAMAGFKVIVAA